MTDNSIYLGTARHSDDSLGEAQHLLLSRANRHGLVTGATGTGKTVTLQVMAEGFSRAGVPVFVADIKGDFSGIAAPGATHPAMAERAAVLGVTDYSPAACPVAFWDIAGRRGLPVRTTLAAMGPTILSRLLSLNNAQRGALYAVFGIAKERNIRLHTLTDLQKAFNSIATYPFPKKLPMPPSSSIAAIQRQLIMMEMQGATAMFGEPQFDVMDMIRHTPDGRGVVNVLAAETLIASPRTYSTFLFWMLSELFEKLPEVGDADKPKLVFFFDEAHLLFDEQNKALLQKIEQIVRMIRSKGVGVYFISQAPQDIPDDVLAQLGNRVQHAMRAYTPKAQRAVRSAADTFRPNPAIDTEAAMGSMVVGEALVSMLDARGVPGMVQRVLIAPPRAHVGPIDDAVRAAVIAESELGPKYQVPADPAPADTACASTAEVRDQTESTPPPAAAPGPDRSASPITSSARLTRPAMAGGTETWRYEVMGSVWRVVTSAGGSEEMASDWRVARASNAGKFNALSKERQAMMAANDAYNAMLAAGFRSDAGSHPTTLNT